MKKFPFCKVFLKIDNTVSPFNSMRGFHLVSLESRCQGRITTHPHDERVNVKGEKGKKGK